MSTIHQSKPNRQPKPLDDLSADAIALLAFVRRHHYPRWYVAGSPSARYAVELAQAGYLALRRDDDPRTPIALYRLEAA